MYNLVLLLMGIVFIFLKNNKKILLKNIFIEKDVDLNSKKQCGLITFPSEYRATESICSSLSDSPSPLASRDVQWGLHGGVWHTHVWFGSMLSAVLASLPAARTQLILAVPSGPGLAALDLAWRTLFSKELPLQVQIRSLNE